MTSGALFVMMGGLMWMLVLCVDSWATPDSVSERGSLFGICPIAMQFFTSS